MSGGSTDLKLWEAEFNLAGVGEWLIAHPVFSVLAFLAVLAFWVLRKEGIGGHWLDYRLKRQELEARITNDQAALTQDLKERARMLEDRRNKPATRDTVGGNE